MSDTGKEMKLDRQTDRHCQGRYLPLLGVRLRYSAAGAQLLARYSQLSTYSTLALDVIILNLHSGDVTTRSAEPHSVEQV
jgi:hypothetical protein